MIQYIVILLDDTAVSFCHYENRKTARRLMPLDTLRRGILFAMKENLNIQFVYPEYELPEEYLEVIDGIDHTDIRTHPQPLPKGGENTSPNPSEGGENCVWVVDETRLQTSLNLFLGKGEENKCCVLRIDKRTLFEKVDEIATRVGKVARLNVVITDVQTFTEEDFTRYKEMLGVLSKEVERLYVEGKAPQLNLLSDRMMLDQMNNCGAGDTSITLAPDGRFYICPAFYLEDSGESLWIANPQEQKEATFAVGDLEHGLDIKNAQLYRLDHAPLCRHCDAYQCKRCVWLNRKTTLEVNTPSHEQCVVAHLERNASRELLANIRKHGTFLPQREIAEIDYIDPFEKRKEW